MVNRQPHSGSGETEEDVLARLRLLEMTYDPVTIRHLETIGIINGWKCLDVGAGAGSIAQWLSTRVGPEGKTVATDVQTRFLQELAGPAIEIRQHDITADPLEKDQYDLVHCRTLLMWLREPEKAVRRMAEAVRPGGWLVLEESDYGSILSADMTNPSAAMFCATGRQVIDFLRNKGIADPCIGRRVGCLMEQLGFTDVVQEGWTRICRGGEMMARFDAAAIQMSAIPMINTGQLTREKLDHMLQFFGDTTFEYPGLTMFSAWGRKPVVE